MKYNYDVEQECFIREDGAGKRININISEAQRIIALKDLGYSIAQIRNKMVFSSNKVYESTIQNFLNNVEKGNIVISGDYPAPKLALEDLTVDMRLTSLEERLENVEMILQNQTDDSIVVRWKKWLKQ